VAASFCRVWKEIGAASWTWESRPVLMIPLKRSSLVLVRDADGEHLRHGPGLHMTRIKKSEVRNVVEKYLLSIDVSGTHQSDLEVELWKAIVEEMVAGAVLLSVKAKAEGTSWLKAGKVKQTVAVTSPLVSRVTFKFLHHLNDKGEMTAATGKDSSQVDGWISDLNWILGAQANVWFDVEKAVPAKINEVLGRPVNDVAFKNYIANEKDSAADVTVFLVGKWEGSGDAGGSFYPNLGNVIALDDKPAIPVVEGGDPFVIVLAHELVHYVLAFRGNKNVFHVKDNNALLNNTGVESTVITSELQSMLSP
jgi:hypothetical protein